MNIINKVTLKGLKANKTRTIVTIIGIILSVAMITAVTTLISSMQNYMLRQAIAGDGNWHAAVHDISYEDAEKLNSMDEVSKAALTRPVGYSVLEGGTNEYKPYLYLMELSDDAFDTWPIHLVEGRLPLNDDEVVISEHIISNGGVDIGIGDTLDLDMGQRVLDGEILYSNDMYLTMEDGTTEELDITITKGLTVVGVMNRLSFRLEGFSSPGYTIVTLKDFDEIDMAPKGGEKDFSVYFTATNSRKVYDTASEVQEYLGIGPEHIEYNSALLRTQGVSDIDGFNAVLYSLGGVLILLIMLGSISLIYNSFSISVSERTKQFGLLSSVGATMKQLKNSVFFEAMFLASIGIPLGILAGISGIGLTLYFVNDLLVGMMSSSVYVDLSLSISPVSVVAAVIIALITILISAYIPARRAKKISAVEAIRQSTDIKLKSKQVKTSWLMRKLLGIEANLALKNMKRSKKRYRSTVISLFVSVALFVSASGFSMYLTDAVMNVYDDVDYDLYYYSRKSFEQYDDTLINKAYENILALDSVKQGSSVDSSYSYLYLQREDIHESSLESNSLGLEDEKGYRVGVSIYAVDHNTFADYISSLGLDQSQFADNSQVSGIVIDRQHYYDYEQEKYLNTSIFKDKTKGSLSLNNSYYENGDEETIQFEVKVAAFADTGPFGISDPSENPGSILLIIEKDSKYKLIAKDQDAWYGPNMYFAADDPFRAEEDIKEVLEATGIPININNIAQFMQDCRNIVTIISIFAYGFIVLISLIAIANVFNTISTNVNLRRREFAMLKSVGMTDKSFNRMLNFECILYGLKGLFYGLPVAILITYLIYRGISEGVEMGFYLPGKGILISIFSVFIVMFLSMMYSMSRIRNENILDELKNENL